MFVMKYIASPSTLITLNNSIFMLPRLSFIRTYVKFLTAPTPHNLPLVLFSPIIEVGRVERPAPAKLMICVTPLSLLYFLKLFDNVAKNAHDAGVFIFDRLMSMQNFVITASVTNFIAIFGGKIPNVCLWLVFLETG